MRITITCPTCSKKSQIDSSLRGKRMRCPYPDCRKPFRLSEAGEAVSLDAPAVVEQPKVVDWQATQGQAGPGGWDMPAVADWQAAPPPQRDGEGNEAPAQAGWQGDGGGWQAPAEAAVEYEDSGSGYESSGEEIDYYAPVKKKKHGLVMLIMILIGVLGLAGGGIAYYSFKARAEEKAANDAAKDYVEGRFSAAESKFRQLAEKFPDGANIGSYRFMERLASFRSAASESSMDVDKADAAFRKFYSEYRGKKEYKEYIDDIWESAKSYVNSGFASAQRTQDRAALTKVRDTFDVVVKDIGNSLKEPTQADKLYPGMEDMYKKANDAVAQSDARKQLVADIDKYIASKLPGDVEAADQRLADEVQRYPNLAKDAAIKAKIDGLRAAEPGLIKYYPSQDKKLEKPAAGAGVGSTLPVCPPVHGLPTAAGANDPAVLSLARGILYAQSLSTGELRWALRVGIDTTILPARLPARPPQPEIALVLSTDATSDTSTVIAINMRTGDPLWSYPLNATCPAGPIVAGRIAYFPTVERTKNEKGEIVEGGKVHEIEAVDGRLMGVFDVGQPLTVPGGYDPITGRLFVPANRKRIYVLDVNKKVCAGVYYTNHTVGGLRAAPIVTPSTLIIAEANSLGSMTVQSFTLTDTGDKAIPDKDKYRIRGWSWFTPFYDGDTVAYLTDRGSLALFGTKRGTADRSVFLLTAPPEKASGDLYGVPVGETRGLESSSQPPVGPAQIAHVDLNEWWLLVSGKLYRYRFDYYRQQLVKAPQEPLDLGAPLQASQARGQYLVLGSQGLDRCLVTAIDRRTSAPTWQRQLGLMTDQEPIVLGEHVLAIDRTGGLFHLQASKVPAAQTSQRIPGPSAGTWLANGLPNASPDSPPRLVASPDGSFALAILHDTVGDKIVLRRYEPGKGIVSEKIYPFASQPLVNGTVAVSNQSIIIPCRDGNLRELPLAGPAAQPTTMAWRSPFARADVASHAMFLSDHQLLATDGHNKLLRWERGAGGRWSKVPDGDLTFAGRLVSSVTLVPGPQGEKLVATADDNGTVYLVSLARSEYVQRWEFKDNKVTKGPFLRGTQIGVVLDESELVWLDPNQPQPLWRKAYTDAKGDMRIVGEPQRIGNYLLVPVNSTDSTTFIWLDPNGTEKGKSSLKARVVPAASAVPLSATQAFVPMSDGTILILPVPGTTTARAD